MQIFPRSLNKLPQILGAVGAVVPAVVVLLVWYYLTPKNFQVGYAPTQPVPYSHRLHVGQLGMDCRYCHANVETAAHAMIGAEAPAPPPMTMFCGVRRLSQIV